jgi:hypothetical protein
VPSRYPVVVAGHRLYAVLLACWFGLPVASPGTVMTRFLTSSHVFAAHCCAVWLHSRQGAAFGCVRLQAQSSAYNDSNEARIEREHHIGHRSPVIWANGSNGGKAGRSPTAAPHRAEGCVSFHSRN